MKLTADNVLWFIYQYNCSVGHPMIIRRRAFEKEFTAQWHTIEPIVNQLEQIDHLIVRRHVYIYNLTEKGLAKAMEMAQYKQENVMVTKRFWMEIGRYLVGLYDRLNSVNCLLVLFSTAMPISANATTWYVTKSGNDSNTGKSVSAAFLTIQKAVDVSVAGDGVLVGDGEYGSISCTKTVTIRSVNGYMKTSIVGNGSRCAFLGYTYGGAEYPKIIGFTLKNGNSGQYAGSAVDGGCIENCYITGCTGSYGVLYSCYARNCVIVNNASGYSRGLCETSKLYNCTIFGNSCDYVAYAETALYNCIYYGNSKNLIYPYSGAVQCYTYNCYSSDPCFKNPADGDFCLASISPCIDAGNNSYSTTDTDLAGKARIYNGSVDIGAYEYQPEVMGGIGNIIAKQRYPWNGKVDLSFVVTGESETAYKTSFVVNDLGATTSVDVGTLYASDGSRLSVTNSLKPGVYKWVWDASQDLPSDFVGERMVIVGNVAEP